MAQHKRKRPKNRRPAASCASPGRLTDLRRAELGRNRFQIIDDECLPSARLAQPDRVSMNERPPNKRLKLAARVDYGMNLSSARRSLSGIR